VDAAQKDYDSTLNELEAAQAAYDNLLTTSAADELNQSRADLAVAQARYDLAVSCHEILLIGDQSRSVAAAQSAVSQAEAVLEQARAAEKQAEANLNLINVQLKKCIISSPLDGVVLARNLETGEVVTPGSAMIVIGKLDPLTLTAYLPEDQYGRVTLGQSVKVTVDSFPGETFSGKVTLIADQAEFTPRNVQTTEGRQGTVFGIQIEVKNPDMKLKPGMPADVLFEE
jgi:HlyD family secretion protein